VVFWRKSAESPHKNVVGHFAVFKNGNYLDERGKKRKQDKRKKPRVKKSILRTSISWDCRSKNQKAKGGIKRERPRWEGGRSHKKSCGWGTGKKNTKKGRMGANPSPKQRATRKQKLFIKRRVEKGGGEGSGGDQGKKGFFQPNRPGAGRSQRPTIPRKRVIRKNIAKGA